MGVRTTTQRQWGQPSTAQRRQATLYETPTGQTTDVMDVGVVAGVGVFNGKRKHAGTKQKERRCFILGRLDVSGVMNR